MNECCKFCGGADLRPDLIEIGALPGGRLYLHRDQTHPGRVILAADRHVKKVTDLSLPEYRALMESVYQTAQAVTDQFNPDKINYLIFGDTSTHLHVHIVPKYQNGKDWGRVFLTDEPEPLFLEEDAYQSICAGLRRRLGLEQKEL